MEAVVASTESTMLELISKTLKIKVENINMDGTLTSDLGIDSIDMLDILHGLEKRMGIVIELSDFSNYVRGSLNNDDFKDENGFITEVGIAQLTELMPNAVFKQPLHVRHIFELLSVRELCRMIDKMAFTNVPGED